MRQNSGAGPGLKVEYAHQSWPADPVVLRPIRDEVHRWPSPISLDPDAHEDLVYAVSEAATNAVEHAYQLPTAESVVEISFWTDGPILCIEIVDHGVWKVPSSEELGRGRGIQMMHQLAESVAIHYDDRGTRVLLRHPLEQR